MMQGIYANIIIDRSIDRLDRTFQYKIPESLRGQLSAGMPVIVPFGQGNSETAGYVLEVTDKAEFDLSKMKEILRIAEKGAGAENLQIRLAAWMKHTYGSTMIAALKTVIPVKQKVKAIEKRDLFPGLSAERLAFQIAAYERRHLEKRVRFLTDLREKAPIPYEEATKTYGLTPAMVRDMETKGILVSKKETQYRNPVSADASLHKHVVLSGEQQQIADEILADLKSGHPGRYLIHGITGSGKTEVYMEIIEGVLRMGKEVIVLIPEIALTYQTVSRFAGRFGERVSVLHSGLSMGERYDQCERARRGEISVMIGPRSALFTPFQNLGLIVMDEEHENSYKSESIPKYHAREAASELASYVGAGVVYGSATPSLEAYEKAKRGEWKLYTLNKRLTGGMLPRVYVEDLRKELRKGNRSIFSNRLDRMMEDRLQKGEQIMLFLNRRGYAGFVSCRACGHVMKCPHCDVSLSQHRGGRLICHYCGYEEPAVTLCPKCGSKYILGFRAGTEQIEEAVRKRFPAARILRMDADTTRTKNSYEEILKQFAHHEADILIGTQMIVKGHDFPDVTLVGILAADLSLHANDYRASERTFQLLTQAAGRAGRGDKPGEVVIQTYQPDHHSIIHAAAQDYEGFFEEEMTYRELLGYPPSAHMVAVLVLSQKEEEAKTLAEDLASMAGKSGRPVTVIGPAGAGIGKINDVYRYVFYVKAIAYDDLIYIKDRLEAYLDQKVRRSESVQFDFDPLNAY